LAQLKRELGFLDVFAVAAGAMISSGLFILPAIAYLRAGPGVVLSYLLASLFIVPSILCQVELATAMPKAGGTYFYIERSLGAVLGLFSGFANWFALAMKSAFAILGVIFLVDILAEQLAGGPMPPWLLQLIAVFLCVGFGGMNIVSVRQTGRFQFWLVAALIVILVGFVATGAGKMSADRFAGFLDRGWVSLIATAGLVFISFGGLTKIASIGEEIRRPVVRNLVGGMLLAWALVSILYVSVVAVTVGVIDGQELSQTLLPISTAAESIMPGIGFAVLALAAIFAFVTTANGGILAASRSPMAMSRDQLLPGRLASVSHRFKTPHFSIALTVTFMAISILLLDLETLVKTASTLLILLYILANLSVIVMRESKIQSYRPRFRVPLYPYVNVASVGVYIILIIDMGLIPLSITAGFVALSTIWYLGYARGKVGRASAIMHIVERITDKKLKTVTLENELRDILIERDNIVADRFDDLIRCGLVMDIRGRQSAEIVFTRICRNLSRELDVDTHQLYASFIQREQAGATIVAPGIAIPHIVIDGERKFAVALVRSTEGIDFPGAAEPVKMMFVLAGSRDERNFHLRALMAIAQICQDKHFEQRWLAARDSEAIRNVVLLATRKRDTR